MKTFIKKLKKEIGLFWAIYSNSSKDWRVQNESCNLGETYVYVFAICFFCILPFVVIFWRPSAFFLGFFAIIFIVVLLQDLHACLIVYFYYPERSEDENS